MLGQPTKVKTYVNTVEALEIYHEIATCGLNYFKADKVRASFIQTFTQKKKKKKKKSAHGCSRYVPCS